MTSTEREGLSTWVREHCTECDGTGRCGLHYDSTCMQCLGTGRRIRSILSPESAVPSATVPKGAPFDEQLPPLTEERRQTCSSSSSASSSGFSTTSSGQPEPDTEAPARRPEQGPLHSVDDFRSELARLRVERDEWLMRAAAWERERWELTRERDEARADQKEADANEETTQALLEKAEAQLARLEAANTERCARELDLAEAGLKQGRNLADWPCGWCHDTAWPCRCSRADREAELDAFGLQVAERVAGAKHRCPRCSEVLLEPDLPGLVAAVRGGQ